MNDPERLLDRAGSVEARLLAALDQPAPADLRARTLATLGAPATPATPGQPAGPTASVAASKAAGSGIAGAAGIGALVGLVAVGALTVMPTRDRSTHDTGPQGARTMVVGETPRPPADAPVIGAPSAGARPVAPEGEAPAPPAPASATAKSAKPPRGTLADEIALMDEARSALDDGDIVRAKALMDRYAREIPHGQLAREAALLRTRVAEAEARRNP